MPQASDALRAEWPGGDREAIAHLEGRGYVLRPNWTWDMSLVSDGMQRIDYSAIIYLIHEWDFGGIGE